MPEAPSHTTFSQLVKPTPPAWFADRGTGTDVETRLSRLEGFLTPAAQFYVRSHSPTPHIDAATWRLRVEGSGVRAPVDLSYDDVRGMPQVSVVRAIECAGNGRRFFREAHGSMAAGVQWRTGAMGVAEWTGVRLRDVLGRAELTEGARDVMPEGLDDHRVRRPMNLEKACRDDTLLVLAMNGEPLPPDHGYPARVLVPGWLGTASIKWVGRIEVSEEPLYSPYNTEEYVLIGPDYPAEGAAEGQIITEMPVMSVIDLDWPATVPAGPRVVRGRSFAGEGRVREVAYSVDGAPWQQAELLPPNIAAAWVRWQFAWDAAPGYHEIRVRATDERGRTQPDTVPWNDKGCLYNAVVAHPVTAVEAR